MNSTTDAISKTQLRRIEQYRDRWSSYGQNTGIREISDKPSPAVLRQIELFEPYDDKFLEKLSPDISIVTWQPGVVLFEQGSFLDLAFFLIAGEVEVYLQTPGDGLHGRVGPATSVPIFDAQRTRSSGITAGVSDITAGAGRMTGGGGATGGFAGAAGTQILPRLSTVSGLHQHEIGFLATMDFDLPRGTAAKLGPGELFGEIGAMSGWPQSVTARTASECKLVQIRVPALRLMKRRSNDLKQRLDDIYRERTLRVQLASTPLFADLPDAYLLALENEVDLLSIEPGEVVVREGEAADAVYLVRSGFLKLEQKLSAGDTGSSDTRSSDTGSTHPTIDSQIVATYLSKGMTLGEVELLLLDPPRWEATVSSVEYAELVKIPAALFQRLVDAKPEIEERLWQSAADRIKEMGASRRDVGRSEFIQTALDQGLVQGSSMLVIDLERCTRCDDCVRACAATHDGRPRFVREGDKVGKLLVARSCYHCQDPVCLVGCPTGAIHRAGIGQVVDVEDEICIGCSTCANNCPYDAIVMHDTGEQWPDDMVPVSLRGERRLVASKCDLCHDTGHDPACVSNCPHGCAFRVGSVDDIRKLMT